jgi:hypothetical protein
MIIEKLFKLTKKDSDLEEVLIGGLIVGLIGGLIVGLIGGLIVGLFVGLIWELGFSINYFAFLGLASLISHYPNFISLWILIIVGIVILEILFWLDTQKCPKKFNKLGFTALKKGEALLETIVIFGYLNLFRLGLKKLGIINWNEALKWTGYIGAGLIVLAVIIGIIYLYIKLNSLKYKR